MPTIRLSTKGQLIIPREIRQRHGWDTGTELVVEDLGHSVAIRSVSAVKPTKLKDVLGCLKYEGAPRTFAEIERAIAAGALESR